MIRDAEDELEIAGNKMTRGWLLEAWLALTVG